MRVCITDVPCYLVMYTVGKYGSATHFRELLVIYVHTKLSYFDILNTSTQLFIKLTMENG